MLFSSQRIGKVAMLVFAFTLALLGFAPGAAQEGTADEVFLSYLNSTNFFPPAVGPLAGEIDLTSGAYTTEEVGVNLADFVLTVDFVFPADLGRNSWQASVDFRQTGSGLPGFNLFAATAGGTWEFIVEGGLRGGSGRFNTGDHGSQVHFALVAVGDVGYVSLNGEPAIELDLSSSPDAGDIFIGGKVPLAGADATRPPLVYQNLSIWEISSGNQPETSPGSDADSRTFDTYLFPEHSSLPTFSM